MKNAAVLLLLSLCLATTWAQTDITAGIPFIMARTAAAECTAGTFGIQCADCSSYMVCGGDKTPLGTEKCSSPNSFCDSTTNACTSVRPSTCSTSSNAAFSCPGEGSVPDPDNCQVYHLCSAAKALLQTFTCPANYVYDAVNGYCKRKVYAADCVTMACTKANVLITHKTNAQFYGFCDADLKLTLMQCPRNQQFDQGCKYVCRAVGYFAGQSAAEFFHCARSGLSYVQSVFKCPEGYEYNDKFNCVKVASSSTGAGTGTSTSTEATTVASTTTASGTA